MREPENEWLRAYRKGDNTALARLIEHTRRPLYGFIYKMVGAHADADEIFQEVWIRAIRNLDHYKDKRFLSWLFRIAHNLIIDRARSQQRLMSLEQAGEEGKPLREEQDPAPNPAQNLTAQDARQRIYAAIARLPPEQREVFLLRAEADLPFKEIARLQGVSINTALARMQYAVRKLRYLLEEDHDDSQANPDIARARGTMDPARTER